MGKPFQILFETPIMEPAISDSIALDVDFQDLDSHHGLGAIIEAIYAEGDDDGREKRASVHVPLVGCTDDDRASHVMLINSLQPSHNVGYKMLMKMGWNSGVGLGKNGQGRVEPIPVIQKADHTGVGKDSQMNEAHVASTANRKQLQSEVIAGETEQEKLTREIRVLQRESIKEEIKSVIAAFYCEICDKQYTKISDYETHLSSYDHHHRKRFKEMQDMQKRGTGHLEKKRARVDKEKEREEREMKRMRDAAMARIRHRGPDWSGVRISGKNILCHERLAIVGVDSGAQPLTNEDGTVILSVNGEIYNHVTLRKTLKKNPVFKTHSDCEIILHLYDELGPELVKHLDGMYSFVLYDSKKDLFLAARDHVGITTLYQGFRSSDGSTWFASEMKSLNEDCDRIISFPPGHYYLSTTKQTVPFYAPEWYAHPTKGIPTAAEEGKVQTKEEEQAMYEAIRKALERSVKKRLMSEVPYGVLLSGGLDSSLIASIAMRMRREAALEAEKADEDDDIRSAISSVVSWPRLHSFSIGLPGSPDLKAAQHAADFLKTLHHSYTFTVQEGLDAIADVIWHLETYDVTTVRASTPMWLLSRKIKATGVKMVLSGEGSDELFGGYLYFHSAPSAAELHHECVSRVKNLHTSDNLRANKSTMAWGLEARVPFLDRAFLDVGMLKVPANQKLTGKGPYNHKMEKHVLRKAFDCKEDPYLPDDILWRQKEQFSDGVGYSWIDSLRDHANKIISDQDFAEAARYFPHDTPTTKEAFWYRRVFERHFPQRACLESVVRWIPRKDWGCPEDPSGRAQKGHEAAYEKAAK
ncbi:asparagine synthetase [Irineochytrium annulatum]|nr:asparagine synthetase [Irineochytrium annulatum]